MAWGTRTLRAAVRGPELGREFRWLWAAYAVGAYGSGFGLGAFSIVAVLALHAGPAAVSALPAAGLAVGAVLAVPLAPWVEARRKRPVMIAMDVGRFAAMLSIPAAYLLGILTYTHLLLVVVLVATAKIAFNAASGAYLKTLVPEQNLIVATGRFEATNWTSVIIGPPLGGAAIGIFGPVVTMAVDAISYLLSALGISAIGRGEPHPGHPATPGLRVGDLLDGWRHILSHPSLRPLLFNTNLCNGLIMAGEPLIAVLMLRQLGFAPWQYSLAFAAPCVGGLIGARSAAPLARRFGRHRIMIAAGVLRAFWIIGLAFVPRGVPGLALVIAVQFGLVTSCGVFIPIFAAYRLEQTPRELAARTLSSWSVTSNLSIAALTMVFGGLASATGVRTALAVAGVAMLATPLLLRSVPATPTPQPVSA
ncbi:MFS transporter [Nocardia sp. alder85J]|uniref:MFS transporter n=1 Tax=Nocardia sp. alder85J TaxID=2862949 RepID=UPI001CD58CF9|nr:MFS transporter [Nocardia sp. alder85J]MCX4096454.1 MFS transporter [Nocardia sp. alder85J]